MEIDPTTLDRKSLYKYLTGSIVPRPIGWISTVDEAGNANLAPYSFFNAVNSDPPHVLFCAGIRAVDGAVKDSLSNVRDNGEFVVNIVTEATETIQQRHAYDKGEQVVDECVDELVCEHAPRQMCD